MGHAPERMQARRERRRRGAPRACASPARVAVLTQTTLSVDDTRDVLDALRRRFPAVQLPRKDDICYATQNRQNAVKAMLGAADLVLVVGAPESSNSNRLVEIACKAGRCCASGGDRRRHPARVARRRAQRRRHGRRLGARGAGRSSDHATARARRRGVLARIAACRAGRCGVPAAVRAAIRGVSPVGSAASCSGDHLSTTRPPRERWRVTSRSSATPRRRRRMRPARWPSARRPRRRSRRRAPAPPRRSGGSPGR